MSKDYLGTLYNIVRACFLGDVYSLEEKRYQLKPVLLEKYSVLRTIKNPSNELERLIKDLPKDFRSVARSELYRKSGGWVEQAERSKKFREIEDDSKSFLIPYLDNGRSIGLDTSSGDDDTSYLAICCFRDAESGFGYLERHLQLPKAKQPEEFKWRKINQECRELVLSKFGTLLSISCDAILLLKTNALKRPEEKLSDIFIKLIDGSFSGYERFQGEFRSKLKNMFFSLMNNTPVHCDSDFAPLSTDKIVRFLVRGLANGEKFVPLHVGLRSEESHPIQVTDIICGSLKNLANKKMLEGAGFKPIPFNDKLKGTQKYAKAYYWLNQKTTQASTTVNI